MAMNKKIDMEQFKNLSAEEQTPELCELAIEQDIESAEYINKQTPDIWRAIMNKDKSRTDLLKYDGSYMSDALTVPFTSVDMVGDSPNVLIHEKGCDKWSSVGIPAESDWICVDSPNGVYAMLPLEEDSTFAVYNPDKGTRTGMTFDGLQDILDVDRTMKDVDGMHAIQKNLEGVKSDGLALEYIPGESVSQNGYALQYVKEQTPELCKLAVETNPWAIQYVKEQTLNENSENGYPLTKITSAVVESRMETKAPDSPTERSLPKNGEELVSQSENTVDKAFGE